MGEEKIRLWKVNGMQESEERQEQVGEQESSGREEGSEGEI